MFRSQFDYYIYNWKLFFENKWDKMQTRYLKKNISDVLDP